MRTLISQNSIKVTGMVKSTFNRIVFRFDDGVVFSFLGVLILVFTVFVALGADSPLMAFLSGFLGWVIVFFVYFSYRAEGFFSPLVLFSVMYFGYVLGGWYYSHSGGDFGKFLGFLTLSRDEIVFLIQFGLMYAVVCYVMFCLGYFVFSRGSRRVFLFRKNGFVLFFERNYMFFVAPLLAIGISYWYWVSTVAAGGLLDLIIFFQAFRHLIADTSITTLPYHLYYAGIFIWLLGSMVRFGKVSLFFLFFSLLGMLMNLTQGRITLSITFIISQIIFVALFDSSKEKKSIKAVFLIVLFAFVVYFLRVASNYLFISKEFDGLHFDIFDVIVGGGNVADLQQLVIIFHTYDFSNSLLGSSYFDWLRNSVGGVLGLSPSSVGLMIKDLYVPESSGAPTPGAIGEAYANFNLAAPFFMFLVGVAFSLVRKLSLESGSLVWLLVYSVFLARFVFVYPKVDSTMLVNFLWGVTPFILVIFVLYFFYSLIGDSNK